MHCLIYIGIKCYEEGCNSIFEAVEVDHQVCVDNVVKMRIEQTVGGTFEDIGARLVSIKPG